MTDLLNESEDLQYDQARNYDYIDNLKHVDIDDYEYTLSTIYKDNDYPDFKSWPHEIILG